MRQTAAGDSLISHAGVCTWGMTLSVSLSPSASLGLPLHPAQEAPISV